MPNNSGRHYEALSVCPFYHTRSFEHFRQHWLNKYRM